MTIAQHEDTMGKDSPHLRRATSCTTATMLQCIWHTLGAPYQACRSGVVQPVRQIFCL